MIAKIEWYREILQHDPGSRAFFPLAQMLAEIGQKDEAVSVLRNGLRQHPDFLEAKLELVSLLQDRQDEDPGIASECSNEVGKIVSLLKAHPSFWRLWAQLEENADAALAVRFLQRSLDAPTLTFHQILLQGLQQTGDRSSDSPPPASVPSSVPASPDISDTADEPAEHGASRSCDPQEGDDDGGVPQNTPTPDTARTITAIAPLVAAAAPVADRMEPETMSENTGEDEEEPVTLRTRSMADVLAEQGDLAGALEIYQELAAAASTPEEAALLRERVAELASQVDSAMGTELTEAAGTTEPTDGTGEESLPAVMAENLPETESASDLPPSDALVPDDTPSPDAASSPSPNKVIHILENLADRLDARAHSPSGEHSRPE